SLSQAQDGIVARNVTVVQTCALPIFNLEDIKAPECFEVERKLRERMNIPVFHDDQHGTAICVAAAFLNGLAVVEKDLKKVKVVEIGRAARRERRRSTR